MSELERKLTREAERLGYAHSRQSLYRMTPENRRLAQRLLALADEARQEAWRTMRPIGGGCTGYDD